MGPASGIIWRARARRIQRIAASIQKARCVARNCLDVRSACPQLCSGLFRSFRAWGGGSYEKAFETMTFCPYAVIGDIHSGLDSSFGPGATGHRAETKGQLRRRVVPDSGDDRDDDDSLEPLAILKRLDAFPKVNGSVSRKFMHALHLVLWSLRAYLRGDLLSS